MLWTAMVPGWESRLHLPPEADRVCYVLTASVEDSSTSKRQTGPSTRRRDRSRSRISRWWS
jgi:hypothetical protein